MFYANSTSAAWVMLQHDPATFQFAQIGWLEKPGQVRKTFVQFADPPYFWHYEFPPLPEGDFNQYEVTRESGSFLFRVDGNFYFGTPATHTPNSTTISAEITTLATQMAGGYSHLAYREWFIFSQIRLGTSWSNYYGTPFNPYPQYFGNLIDPGNQTLFTWDKACPR